MNDRLASLEARVAELESKLGIEREAPVINITAERDAKVITGGTDASGANIEGNSGNTEIG